jgi:hypothetical protein
MPFLAEKLERAKQRLTHSRQLRMRWERQMAVNNKQDQRVLASLVGDERTAEFDVTWIERELSMERVGTEL